MESHIYRLCGEKAILMFRKLPLALGTTFHVFRNHAGCCDAQSRGNSKLVPQHAPHLPVVQLLQLPSVLHAANKRYVPLYAGM